jgi:hypothetical protein
MAVGLAVLLAGCGGVAVGEELMPWWGVGSGSRPTVLRHGRVAQIVASVENLGDADANGGLEPVKVEVTLPAGLTALEAEGLAGAGHGTEEGPVMCDVVNQSHVTCMFQGTLHAYEPLEVRVSVRVGKTAVSGERNTVSVSGGGGPQKTISRAIQVGGKERFGVQENLFVPEEAGGAIDTQAGSHPFQLTSTVSFNQGKFNPVAGGGEAFPVGMPRDISVLSPPGLLGNPTVFTQCTDAQFLAPPGQINNCPVASVIGVAVITFEEPLTLGLSQSVTPVFNLVPDHGEPARFGFDASIVPVTLDVSVRTGGDYGATVSSYATSQVAGLLSSRVTLWGVPGDPRHDGARGWECLRHDSVCSLGETTPPPFLSMPTSCTGPLQSSVQVDSWANSEEVLTAGLTEPLPGLDGCNHLSFDPSISVRPDSQQGSVPTGLTVGVHLPQSATLSPTGLAESTIKDTSVTLPEGLSLNASGADGLQACSTGQVGFLPEASYGEQLDFTPAPAGCPDAAKVGTVKLKTPLLPNPLEGAVYLAAQNENPFGSLIAMYLVAEDHVSGTLLKFAGEVSLNSQTGQILSTFKNTPPLPFEDLELHFFGGERAPLATPPRCGSYTTTALFSPWSGREPSRVSSSFPVNSGPAGSACPGATLPFAPSLTGGTTNVQAGGFTPFTTTMSRPDGDQQLRSVQLHMPPGVSGVLTGVPLCPEAQANAGSCPAGSLIGETTVSVGLGGDPYTVTGGKVYLTGPYGGAPFGLSIVNPAKAGPFDLEREQPCDCLVVRAKIEVDPQTAQLTVTSDGAGAYAIPTMLDGIPLNIKHVNVTVNRPSFTFNPTNCRPLTLSGELSSAEGASQKQLVPFQVTDCAALKFAPKFAAATSGMPSRLNGAPLTVHLNYPKARLGSQANIARVKVELPKRLPSRLTTLQKACAAAQFAKNPAGCPVASIVGHAKATTPILPVPLEGPAYFVSHGGEAFPSLIIVLQGYGVTVDLVGTTFISKKGITSTTFKTVPDVPVGSFALTLPQGPYSALTANGNLCKGKLAMPTEFIAQDGTKLRQKTLIKVTGCAHHAGRKAKMRKRQ